MKLKAMQKRNRTIGFVVILLIVAVLICSSFVEFDFVGGIKSVPKALEFLFTQFVPDKNALMKLPDIMKKLIETILLSIAATMTAAILSIVLAIFGSKVTRINGVFSTIARTIASISRNIPDSVWALIFLLSFGQNILTGYFALFFASLGILTRAFIEVMDEASVSSVEGLKSVGGSRLQIVTQSVIPSSLPGMMSWILYLIENNIRSSTLIGILTGTGIGFLFDVYYKSMNYQTAGLVVIAIVLVVILIELTSNRVRRVIL